MKKNNDIFYPIDVISVPKAFGIIGDPLFMLPGFPIKLEMTKIYYFVETLIILAILAVTFFSIKNPTLKVGF